MNMMKKTAAGTLSAYRYEQDGSNGIAVGFYDKEAHATRGIVFLEVGADGAVTAAVDGEQFRSHVQEVKHTFTL